MFTLLYSQHFKESIADYEMKILQIPPPHQPQPPPPKTSYFTLIFVTRVRGGEGQ